MDPDYPDHKSNAFGGHAFGQTPAPTADNPDPEALDPVLQQQVDENLQLFYRSKLEAELPDTLQALVQKLLNDGGST